MGVTSPRLHSPFVEGNSRGEEVIAFAKQIGEELMPFQELVVRDFFAVDENNDFLKRVGLLLMSRQNGKSHLARIMCLAHLFLFKSDRVLIMSSNRGMALVSFREMCYTIEANKFLSDQVKAIRHANGSEAIELTNEAGGGRLDVVAANRGGSRGRTANFMWCDELREVSVEAFTAVQPVTRATDGQSFYSSNAGDGFSEALNDLRNRCVEYPPPSIGFYEWSAPNYCKIDPNSKLFWDQIAQANPALGYRISEGAITEALATSTQEAIRTEVLCTWVSSLSSPFPDKAIEEISDASLVMSPGAYTVFGFDKSPDSRHVALCAGQLLPDGRIGIGVLELFDSALAIDEMKVAAVIKSWADIYHPKVIMYDKYACQTIADRLSNAGCQLQDCSGAASYQAAGDLLDAVVNQKMVHNGQKSLIEQFGNVAAKQNDSSWRIVKRLSAGKIAIPIAVSMIVTTLIKPMQNASIYIET